jgi:sporulation protein YlmC with PRC-barrel domain
MRKIIVVLSTLTLVSMLLAACAGEETSTVVPGTDVPPMTEEPTTEEPLATETVVPTEEGTPDAGIPVTGEEDPSRLSNQLDYDVWNQEGDQIGEVNDMIVDLGNSRVSYVIVGTGGFLEIGERDILVPWESLQLQTAAGEDATGDENAFILQTDQETFENAPDVDVNAVLPPLGEPAGDWDADIRNFWQSGVVPEAPPADGTAVTDMTATVSPDATAVPDTGDTTVTGELQGVILASELLNSNITVGADGVVTDDQVVGTPAATAMPDATATLATDTDLDTEGQVMDAAIDDVIVNIDSGDILYFVISSIFDDGERLIPVPLSQFNWDATNGAFVLDVDSTMLRDAPFFVDGQYPDMTVEGWDSDYSVYWP